jgi:hypothetical protein
MQAATLFWKIFGKKKPEVQPLQAETVPESVLEHRRLNELPPPRIKRLPLDAAAVEACGPPSHLHPPVKPAQIVDEVPEGYDGELYYRIVPSQRGAKRNIRRYVRLVHPKGVALEDWPGQRLAAAWAQIVAQGRERGVFVEPGKLYPDLERDLPARLLASAKKPFPELVSSNWPIASDRFRRVLESLEPGAHLFLPLDTSDGGQPPLLHIFFAGAMFRPTGLAISANGIAGHILPEGGLSFNQPKLSARHFYYLNANVIGSAELFVDTWLGTIFSRRVLERLGDVLPPELAFMPMGVCAEPPPADAMKCTRYGKTEPLA